MLLLTVYGEYGDPGQPVHRAVKEDFRSEEGFVNFPAMCHRETIVQGTQLHGGLATRTYVPVGNIVMLNKQLFWFQSTLFQSFVTDFYFSWKSVQVNVFC